MFKTAISKYSKKLADMNRKFKFGKITDRNNDGTYHVDIGTKDLYNNRCILYSLSYARPEVLLEGDSVIIAFVDEDFNKPYIYMACNAEYSKGGLKLIQTKTNLWTKPDWDYTGGYYNKNESQYQDPSMTLHTTWDANWDVYPVLAPPWGAWSGTTRPAGKIKGLVVTTEFIYTFAPTLFSAGTPSHPPDLVSCFRNTNYLNKHVWTYTDPITLIVGSGTLGHYSLLHLWEGYLFFNYDNKLYCLNATTGVLEWSVIETLSGGIATNAVRHKFVILKDFSERVPYDKLICTNTTGSTTDVISCFNIDDGSLVWTEHLGGHAKNTSSAGFLPQLLTQNILAYNNSVIVTYKNTFPNVLSPGTRFEYGIMCFNAKSVGGLSWKWTTGLYADISDYYFDNPNYIFNDYELAPESIIVDGYIYMFGCKLETKLENVLTFYRDFYLYKFNAETGVLENSIKLYSISSNAYTDRMISILNEKYIIYNYHIVGYVLNGTNIYIYITGQNGDSVWRTYGSSGLEVVSNFGTVKATTEVTNMECGANNYIISLDAPLYTWKKLDAITLQPEGSILVSTALDTSLLAVIGGGQIYAESGDTASKTNRVRKIY